MNFDDYVKLTWNDAYQFLGGIKVTLTVTLISIFLGTILGTIIGAIRCSKNKIISSIPLIFIEPLRNSPVVVQLFMVYYGLPMVSHIIMSEYESALFTFTLNTAAFFAVIVHNCVKAIPQAQWEAGYALGHSKFSTIRNIIGTQVIRLLIPQAVTLYIGQLQCSSLVALINLSDITKVGDVITARTFKPFIVWGIVFALYFIVSFPLSKLAQKLEKKYSYSL